MSLMVQVGSDSMLESKRFNEALLAVCAIVYGFSFVVLKDAVDTFPPCFLMACRFSIGAILMLVVIRRKISLLLERSHVRAAILIGVLQWAGFMLQTFGITMTTPGRSAFLTGCYCVLVPFCAWAVGAGRPRGRAVVSALVCLAGLGLVSLDGAGGSILGDVLTLGGAVFFAFQMVTVAREGSRCDVWVLTCWQLIVMAVLSIASMVVLGQWPDPASFDAGSIATLAFLGVVCSFAYFALMNKGLTRVEPSVGALLSSLESPAGVAFSVALTGELLTQTMVAGFVLIGVAVVISQTGGDADNGPGEGTGEGSAQDRQPNR